MNINQLVRPNILAMKSYSSARDEFTGTEGTFLDANENPFGTLNRYPDPYQRELKQELCRLKSVNPNQIFIGNGSDEVIDLAFRIFCQPEKDKALTFSPSYGMYDVSAAINQIELIKLPLNPAFQIDLDALNPYFNDSSIKLMFICSPNNPTGNMMNAEDIQFILENFKGIVIIDEAYIDFSSLESSIFLIKKYNHLIISQTFSKAWGLAAARVGTAYANEEIIGLYNKVKPPYNVSKLNQDAALNALRNYETFQRHKAILLSEKKRLSDELQKIHLIKKIYPSDANFLLIEVENANQLYLDLIDKKIITRNRNTLISNCLRISIGSPAENNQLLNALKSLL